MKITKDIEDIILQLNKERRSNRYIANELGIARSSVKKVLNRYGKKTHNLHIRLERRNNQLKCLVCNKFKDYETFVYAKSRNAGGTCGQCRTKQRREKKHRDLESFFYYKWRTSRDRALKAGLDFDLTVGELIEQYEQQDKICFYTDRAFADFTELKSQNTISIDRIDSKKGYTRDNIVLCLYVVNRVKSDLGIEDIEEWMPEWGRRLKVKAEKDLGS